MGNDTLKRSSAGDAGDAELVSQILMRNIYRHRATLADTLALPWPQESPGIRVWHASYLIPLLGEFRVASVMQWRGVSSYSIGVVRDVGDGGGVELKYAAMTSLAAVVFLGLHMVDTPVEWRQEL